MRSPSQRSQDQARRDCRVLSGCQVLSLQSYGPRDLNFKALTGCDDVVTINQATLDTSVRVLPSMTTSRSIGQCLPNMGRQDRVRQSEMAGAPPIRTLGQGQDLQEAV